MKFIPGQIALTRHEREFGVHLPHNLERDPAFGTCPHQIERGIGVAAQAVSGLTIDDAFGHQLRDDVDAARQQI